MSTKPTTDRQRRRLHDLVAARVEGGDARGRAMFAIAAIEGVRPGIVAASYWIVERELHPGVAAPAPLGQMRLDS